MSDIGTKRADHANRPETKLNSVVLLSLNLKCQATIVDRNLLDVTQTFVCKHLLLSAMLWHCDASQSEDRYLAARKFRPMKSAAFNAI